MSMYTPRLLQQPRDYFTVGCSHARRFIRSSPRKCGVHARETVIKNSNDAVVLKKITRIAFRVFS